MALLVDLLEIAHDLVDVAHDGKGMGAFPDDGGQGGGLGPVHHADQDADLLAQVHAGAGDQGGAVVEPLDDGIGDLLGPLGDDLEADSPADALCHPVRDGGGHEAVKDAQQHRLDLIIVDEIGHKGHSHIQGEYQPENILVGAEFMDDGGDEIRAAGVGPALDQQDVAGAEDDACHQGAQNGAGAVLGVVDEMGHIPAVQHHQGQGIHQHIDHAADGQGLIHLEIDPDRQGDIDDQAQIAHADAADVLDHGAHTVQSRRGKPVGEYEQLVVKRAKHRQRRDHKIRPCLFQ